MKFYPMPMHLHASHEPTASIGAHMAHAAALGIRYTWLTEHDGRMGTKKRPLPFFSFPKKKLFCEFENGVRAGFKEEDGSSGSYELSDAENGITLDIKAENGERESLFFYSKGKNHSDPLFANIAVELDADILLSSDKAGAAVEFVLSAQPPSFEQALLRYELGSFSKSAGEAPELALPMPKKNESGVYRFELTADASEEIGGLDNALCYVRLTVTAPEGESASLTFRSFRFLRELNFEPVRQRQKLLAAELGKKWGVTPFVSFEITEAGHHKNCYSTTVPVIDYGAADYKVTQEDAIRHVFENGGIFCYNHPFTEWKNDKLTDEEKDALVERIADEFARSRVFGATLMEVGFPEEKEGFCDRHYLRLWDLLSARGVFITGDGDSDNHHATDVGWLCGNNFVTYTGIFEHEEPSEESFVRAFVRGSVWMGDPAVMGEILFEADGLPQGSVLVGERREISFRADGVKSDGVARIIINGKCEKELPIENGKVEADFSLPLTEKYGFARVELRNSNGRLIALTNPVYLVREYSDITEKDMIRTYGKERI